MSERKLVLLLQVLEHVMAVCCCNSYWLLPTFHNAWTDYFSLPSVVASAIWVTCVSLSMEVKDRCEWIKRNFAYLLFIRLASFKRRKVKLFGINNNNNNNSHLMQHGNRTLLHTVNKLPRRTAQQVPAHRPGITAELCLVKFNVPVDNFSWLYCDKCSFTSHFDSSSCLTVMCFVEFCIARRAGRDLGMALNTFLIDWLIDWRLLVDVGDVLSSQTLCVYFWCLDSHRCVISLTSYRLMCLSILLSSYDWSCYCDNGVLLLSAVENHQHRHKGFFGFNVRRPDNSETCKKYLTYDTPFLLPHHLSPCADYSIAINTTN